MDGAEGSEGRWELYRLLSEPVRLRVLGLVAEEELAVGELAEVLGEVQPNVSRHVGVLRQAGLVRVRRQGTWALVRFAEPKGGDAVVADAVATGKALCARDGTRDRARELVAARDQGTREFFSRHHPGTDAEVPRELPAYLFALSRVSRCGCAPGPGESAPGDGRALAVDAGTGDGGLLEALAPQFARVVAVDRSGAQLARCRERVERQGFHTVTVVEGELAGPEVREAVGPFGADLVVCARVLHHAPRPAEAVRGLASLLRQDGRGALLVLDYARHEDEALRSQHADLWLGFEAEELVTFAREAGLSEAVVHPIPRAWCGAGPDRHLPWHALVATGRSQGTDDTHRSPVGDPSHDKAEPRRRS